MIVQIFTKQRPVDVLFVDLLIVEDFRKLQKRQDFAVELRRAGRRTTS